jgi:peroxiredoxin
MRFPRLSANTWVALTLLVILAATVSEQMLRPRRLEKPPAERPQVASTFAGPFKLGQEAPNFTLKDVKGRPVSLHQYRGKRVLLNFFCGCSFCRGVAMSWGRMLSMEAKQLKPTETLAVASFKPDYDKQFRQESGWKGKIVYESGPRAVATKYDSRICPRVWVLDEKGRILYTNPSPLEAPPGPELEFAVRPHLLKNPPPPGDIHAGFRNRAAGHTPARPARPARG